MEGQQITPKRLFLYVLRYKGKIAKQEIRVTLVLHGKLTKWGRIHQLTFLAKSYAKRQSVYPSYVVQPDRI
jgi:hypothetical protein